MAAKVPLTPAIHAKACDLARKGHFRIAIARAIGVSYDTLRRWIHRGETGEEPYASFAREFQCSEANGEADALEGIIAQGATQWKALAWFLERRWPETYAPKARIEAEAEQRVIANILERLSAKLPSETLRHVLAALEDSDGGHALGRGGETEGSTLRH